MRTRILQLALPGVAALAALVALSSLAHASAPAFKSVFTSYNAPGNAYRAATGDFDDDGLPDIAIVSSVTNWVTVWRGAGGGEFAPSDTLAGSTYIRFIAVADLDEDGDEDIVVTGGNGSSLNYRVGAFFGQAGAGFGPLVDIGEGGDGLAVADCTGDGHADVVVGNIQVPGALVYPGDGAGNFGAPDSLHWAEFPNAIAVADLDGDGLGDIIGAAPASFSGAPGLFVSLHASSNSFAAPAFYAESECVDVMACDLDEDGTLDLISGNRFLKGLGSGLFAPPVVLGAVPEYRSIAADFDGDGHLDLASTGSASSTLQLYRGRGDGTMEPPSSWPIASSPTWLGSADADVDGDLDLLAVTFVTGQLQVFLSTPVLSFGTATRIPTNAGPRWAQFGDVTGDGRGDVVVTSGSPPMVQIFPGDGVLGFGPAMNLPAIAGVSGIAQGDLNGDGVVDLVTTSGTSLIISTWLGQGGGVFGSRTDYTVSKSLSHLLVADLNGDGRDDVVAGSSGVLRFLSAPDGTLGPEQILTGNAINSIALHDETGDGRPDLLAQNSAQVYMFPGSASGTFGSPVVSSVLGLSDDYRSAFGDLDGDGDFDAVVAAPSPSNWGIRWNAGGGAFVSGTRFFKNRWPQWVAIADMDEDGRTDFVAANIKSDCASVQLALPDSTFTVGIGYGSGDFPQSGLIADVNGDGHLDILTVNFSNDVTILLNTLGGTVAVETRPAPIQTGLAIRMRGPMPATSALRLAFRLPSRGDARLDLFDVSGRRVMRLELGTLEAGDHATTLPRPAGARAGVYWVRLSHDAGSAQARAVFVE